jgi:SpoIID/LytB domain protein
MRRSVVAALVGVLVAAVLPVLPARAATKVIIRGGGWGHGIGLGQYGTYQRAKNGQSAPAILTHYYSNTRVRAVDMPRRIRVGLLQGQKEIGVSSSAEISWYVGGELIARGSGATWRVEPSSTGGMRLYKNGNRIRRDGRGVFGRPSKPLKLRYAPSIVHVVDNGREYRLGKMEFSTYPTDSCSVGYCTRLVVILSMQKYLYGLGEVPSSWPQAALRAQAIAGRTYALEKVKRSGQNRYPCACAVYDSTFDQAYVGDEKRTGSGEYWDDWKGAVDATNRKVVLHKGNPIQALYSSSSGGHTEHNENVWGGTPAAYLRGVPDGPDDNNANPNHTWMVTMSWSEFSSRLNAAYGTGDLQKFDVVKPRGISKRVTVVKSATEGGVRIVGSKKTVRESGWSIRSALSLKDTLFFVEVVFGVGDRFVAKYEQLDGAPGDATSTPYSVPRGWNRPRGRAQDFERGRMTWIKSTDKVVWQYGKVLDKYDAIGREASDVGMPDSGIWGPGTYQGARYIRGLIIWSEAYGARVVKRRFYDAFRRVGGVNGALGVPRTGQQRRDTLPDGGRRQRFADGTLYLNPDLGEVFALWGLIEQRYRGIGEASSACGYPTADMTVDGSSATATFQNGEIVLVDGTVTVDCSA